MDGHKHCTSAVFDRFTKKLLLLIHEYGWALIRTPEPFNKSIWWLEGAEGLWTSILLGSQGATESFPTTSIGFGTAVCFFVLQDGCRKNRLERHFNEVRTAHDALQISHA